MLKKQKSFKSEINQLVNNIQLKFDSEYNSSLTILNAIHEGDAKKTKQKRQKVLKTMDIDESVREKLQKYIK